MKPAPPVTKVLKISISEVVPSQEMSVDWEVMNLLERSRVNRIDELKEFGSGLIEAPSGSIIAALVSNDIQGLKLKLGLRDKLDSGNRLAIYPVYQVMAPVVLAAPTFGVNSLGGTGARAVESMVLIKRGALVKRLILLMRSPECDCSRDDCG